MQQTKAAKTLPTDFTNIREKFYERIEEVIREYNIPPEMIVNIDQTGIQLVPVSDWTMEERGSNQVPITGVKDKCQITGVTGVSLTGNLLPLQLIYQGKTAACHPTFNSPKEQIVTQSVNHWTTVDTMLTYAKDVLWPYFDDQRDKLDLPLRQRDRVILYVYKVHQTREVKSAIKNQDVELVFVPACCTSELQPLDVSGNGFFKQQLKQKFCDWYADQVSTQLNSGKSVTDINIDLKLSTIKPLHANWVLSAFDTLAGNTDVLKNGWEKTGIAGIVNDINQD